MTRRVLPRHHRAGVRLAPLLVGLGHPAAAAGGTTGLIRFDEQSEYERVLVIDEGDLRILRFDSPDGDDQSMISLSDANAVPMDYIRLSLIGALLIPRIERVLVIGVGGGTFPRLLHRAIDDVQIDAVDIDPVVIRVAIELFGLRPDRRLRVHAEDGARWVERTGEVYDLIMLDAYGADGIPSALTSDEFFTHVRDRLSLGGIVVANISADAREEAMVLGRLRRALPHNACIRTQDRLNILLFASRSPLDTGPALSARARQLTRQAKLPFDLAGMAKRIGARCEVPD